MKRIILIAVISVVSSVSAHCAVLLSSTFDDHNIVIDPNYVRDVSGDRVAKVHWITDPLVSTASNLYVISSGGGFVNLDNEISNNNTLMINCNLNSGGARGFKTTFSIKKRVKLEELSVVVAHADGKGNGQIYTSDLTYRLSGGTLTGAVSDHLTHTYNRSWCTADFDLSETTIGPGTYTLQVQMNNLVGEGAYAVFDQITLTSDSQSNDKVILGFNVMMMVLIGRIKKASKTNKIRKQSEHII